MAKFGGLALHSGELSVMEYMQMGESAFHSLPGVRAYGEGGGQAPVRKQIAFGGAAQAVGIPRPQEVAIDAFYAPADQGWKDMRALLDSGVPAIFRLETPRLDIFSISGAGNTVAIAVTGAVTFAKAADGAVPNFKLDLFAKGQVIVVGGKFYRIDTINKVSGAVAVRPVPAPAVAASVSYDIRVPALRREFVARVSHCDEASLQTEDDLRTPLMLAPISRLPEFEVLI